MLKLPALPRRFSSPVLHLVLLGILTWFAYLHLAINYPLADYVAKYSLTDFGRANNWNSIVGIDFILSTFSALLFCLLGWLVVRRHPHDQRLLWITLGFAVLFAFTFLLMYPITATDIFEYVFHSRILTRYGQNPLTVAPSAFKGDSFLKTIPWAEHPSPYGPLWVLLTVPGSLIAGSNFVFGLYLMNGLVIPFYLGSILLVAAILRRMNPEYKLAGTLLFAWNPLVLFEGPGNGHNGIMMIFFALLAIFMMVKRKWMWVIPTLLASVLIKWVTAIFIIPFLIYCWRAQPDTRARWRYLVGTLFISETCVLLAALPFWSIPTGLLEEANFYSLLAIPSVVYNLLLGNYGDKMAKALTIVTSVLTYGGIYLLSIKSFLRKPHLDYLVRLNVFLIVVYLGIANMHFQPWFVVWPVALGIWIDHRVVRPVLLAITGSALFSYIANFWWIWNYNAWTKLQVNIILALVIFVPPIVIGILTHIPTTFWQKRFAWQHVSN